jgi:hypothetical protein
MADGRQTPLIAFWYSITERRKSPSRAARGSVSTRQAACGPFLGRLRIMPFKAADPRILLPGRAMFDVGHFPPNTPPKVADKPGSGSISLDCGLKTRL